MKPQEKSTLISEYGRTDKDTGSTPVQVAVLTHRIKELTSHNFSSPSAITPPKSNPAFFNHF